MMELKRTSGKAAKTFSKIKERKDQEGFDMKYVSEIKGYSVLTSHFRKDFSTGICRLFTL